MSKPANVIKLRQSKDFYINKNWYRGLFLQKVLTSSVKCAAAFAIEMKIAKAALVIKKYLLVARRKHMKAKQVKKLLFSEIKAVANNITNYCFNPKKDFTRNRKLPVETVLKGTIGMESGSLTNELINLFQASPDMPTTSAFVQQRNKIKPEAFKTIFERFSNKIMNNITEEMPILAIDGSDIQIATNPKEEDSYYPGTDGRKGYNLLHLNALYDLKQCIYLNAVIQQKTNKNEHKALQEMIDSSAICQALVIGDRGFESYNSMAHIQEKGWFFLFRVKDGNIGIKSALELPNSDEFDIEISLKLTRKQTKEIKELCKNRNHYRFISSTTTFDYLPVKQRKKEPPKFYELHFRIVRFPISDDTYEVLLTNLDKKEYPASKLKQLYALRWGIETSFRDLKYTIGMLNFHSKKVMCIQQEIYAHLIMYNFAEMITSHVVIEKKQRRHTYKANFSVAVHMCRKFYRGETTPPNLEAIIAKNLVPIRPNRHRERNLTTKVFHGFLYRVA